MKTLEKITTIHFDHSLWSSEFRYYLEEIPIYRSRIAALIDKENSKERRKALKKFAARFQEQGKQLKSILRQIKKHEMRIYHLTHMNGSLKSISNRSHEDIRDQVIAMRVHYQLLKRDFDNFLYP